MAATLVAAKRRAVHAASSAYEAVPSLENAKTAAATALESYFGSADDAAPVSYTHLTLPTICSV